MDRVEIETDFMLRSPRLLLSFLSLAALLCFFSIRALGELVFRLVIDGPLSSMIDDRFLSIMAFAPGLAILLSLLASKSRCYPDRLGAILMRSAHAVAIPALILAGLLLDVPLACWAYIAGTIAVYLGITALMGRHLARIVLDGSRLEIHQSAEMHRFDLEDIRSIERDSGMLGHVRINGEAMPGLRNLSEAEESWLTGLILETAKNRREALARQGHDLAAPPALPAALLARVKQRQA